jgi:hypothetical protein
MPLLGYSPAGFQIITDLPSSSFGRGAVSQLVTGKNCSLIRLPDIYRLHCDHSTLALQVAVAAAVMRLKQTRHLMKCRDMHLMGPEDNDLVIIEGVLQWACTTSCGHHRVDAIIESWPMGCMQCRRMGIR